MVDPRAALAAVAATLLVTTCFAAAAQDAPERTLRYRVVETGIELLESNLQTALNNRGEIAVTLLGSDGRQRAAHWRAGRLTTLADGAASSQTTGLNDCGVVAGLRDGQQVTWDTRRGNRETVLTPLVSAPIRSIRTTPINNRGEVVVSTPCGADGRSCLSIWRAGQLRDLGFGRFDRVILNTFSFHLSDLGEVAVDALVRDLPTERTRRAALVWRDGAYRELQLPFAAGSRLTLFGINSIGAVIGSVSPVGSLQAQLFKWVDGVPSGLPSPADATALVLGLNRHGDAVGLIAGQQDSLYAALWRHGSLVNLNDVALLKPAEELIAATGINDRGWIVAELATNRQAPLRVVLLKPVGKPDDDRSDRRPAHCRLPRASDSERAPRGEDRAHVSLESDETDFASEAR